MRFVWVACALCCVSSSVDAAGVNFHRDVRPILSRHCFKCHGPDENARKGGLRLDLPEAAARGGDSGEKALVPGKPAESEIIRRIQSRDEAEMMPPPSAKLPLTEAQKEILRKWVAEGAEYKPHWAFVAPKQKPLPKTKLSRWVRNPIDAFVLAKMEAAGLQPSPEADKYTLVRRVYLDLIGLPPAPEEVDAFVKDSAPDAYEKLVDRLLQSPHYGERWARRWLDLARYADTNGYEKDRPRSIWPYRDWVINAFNADLPFDQFTIEQLAGDLLPNATLPQRIATGFHRNTMLNEEGGIDPQEFRFHSLTDRVATTGTAWLGLTVGCAQCHTHKYDPISHTEYYQFLAFMNNVDEPVMDVPQGDVAAKRADYETRIATRIADLAKQFPPERKHVSLNILPKEVTTDGKSEAKILSLGTIKISGTIPEKETTRVTFVSDGRPVSAVWLKVTNDPSLPDSGPGYGPDGKFALSEIAVETVDPAKPDTPQAVKLVSAFANEFAQSGPPHYAIDGKADTGWSLRTDLKNTRGPVGSAVFLFEKPITIPKGSLWRIRLEQTNGRKQILGNFEIMLGNEVPDPRPLAERSRKHLEKKFAEWDRRETERVVRWEPLEPVAADANLPILTILPDRSIRASSDQTKRDVYDVDYAVPPQKKIAAFRLEAIADDALPKRGPGRVYYEGPLGDFFLGNLAITSGGQPVKLTHASQSFASAKNTADKAIDADPQSGWSIDGAQGESQTAVFELEKSLEVKDKLHLQMVFERYYAAGLGRFRLSVTSDTRAVKATSLPFDVEQIFLVPPAERTAEQRERLMQQFLLIAPELSLEQDQIRQLRKEMPSQPTTLVMLERPKSEPRTTHRYHRGEFLQPKEEVRAGVPAFLPALPAGATRDRLAFARWLVDPANPLTARVTVNRHWATLFEKGIVKTVEDFGFQGDAPTHPELLDWLAVDFVKQGWSIKKLHRLMLTSATYRQASRVSPEKFAKDPQNVWLARSPRFRLEGELIRDVSLRISGLLTTKVGGPSVFPPQPANLTANTEGTYGELAWKVSTGSDRYRRSMYTFSKRTSPFAMLATFDVPSGEACVARREVSNTPLHALTLLNDINFLEAAQALGKKVAERSGSTEEKLDWLFRACVVRPAQPEETEMLLKFVRSEGARLEKGELDAEKIAGSDAGNKKEVAVWTLIARTLFNLDEVVTRN